MFKPYIPIAILVVALAGTALFTWPKYQELSSLNRNIEEKKLELLSNIEYFSHIRGVAEELRAYEASLSKISSALPEDPLLPATFNFLQNTASQSGLVLGEVAVGNVISLEGKPIVKDAKDAPRRARAIKYADS